MEEENIVPEEEVVAPVRPRRSRAPVAKNVSLEDSLVFGETFQTPVYNQDNMKLFYKTGNRRGNNFTLQEFLAHRVVRDILRKNPELTEEDISVDSLVDGTAPILNNFNFITDKSSKETTSGADLTPDQKAFGNVSRVFSFFARGPSGEKITPGEFGEGVKSKIIPAAVSFPTFYAGAKATNLALSGVPPVTPITAAIRIGAPVIGGLAASIMAQKPAQTANDYIFGVPKTYLPDQGKRFKTGQTFMEGLGWLYAPYLFQGNIGANLAINHAASRSEKAASAVQRMLSSVQKEARTQKFRTAAVELTSAYGAAEAAGQASVSDDPLLEFIAEVGGALTGGFIADTGLKRVLPTAKYVFNAGKKLKDRTFRKETLKAAGAALGDNQRAELALYAYDTLVSVGEDPAEILERLRAFSEQRAAYQQTGKVEFTPDFAAPFKGEILPEDVTPAQRARERLSKFGDVVSDTINPDTKEVIPLPTALAANSLGFQLLQESMGGTNPGGLQDKASAAKSQLQDTIEAMIVTGFASQDKDMIGLAAELAQTAFAKGLDDGVSDALLKYQEAQKRLSPKSKEAVLVQEGRALQEIIFSRLNRARNNEKRLWQNVPRVNISLGSFRDDQGVLNTMSLDDGTVVNVPNFVTEWLNVLPTNPKDLETFLKDPEYADINKYVNETMRELGLSNSTTSSLPTNSFAARYRGFRQQMQGTDRLAAFDAFITDPEFQALPLTAERGTPSKVTRLQEESTRLGGGGRGATTGANEYRNMVRSYIASLDAEQNAAAASPQTTDSVGSDTLTFRRSRMLNEARKALAAQDQTKANFMGNMAGAFLDDLNSYDGSDMAEYHLARAYSKALNDSFTRPYVGKLVARDRSGATRVTPETVIDNVFNSSFAGERARAIDAVGRFEISQQLTSLLNMSPLEVDEARNLLNDSLSRLPSGGADDQRNIAALRSRLSGRSTDDAIAEIDVQINQARQLNSVYTEMGDPAGFSDTYFEAMERLRNLYEAQGTALGQNIESAEAGELLQIIKQQAFNDETGFIELDQLGRVLSSHKSLLDRSPTLKTNLESIMTQNQNTRAVMERGLRGLRDLAFDENGKFSRATAEKWIKGAEARGFMQAFPDLRDDMQKVLDTDGAYLKAVLDQKDRVRNQSAEQVFFDLLSKDAAGNFTAYEDMTLPFEGLFDNKQGFPTKKLNDYWSVAKNAPAKTTMPDGKVVTQEQAKQGFKSSLIGAVLNNAGLSKKGSFSSIKAYETFFQPLKRSDSKLTLSDWMVENNVMPKEEVNRLKGLLTRMAEIDILVASGKSVDAEDLTTKLGTSVELVASALGSSASSRLFRMLGGDPSGTSSLAVVSRGSTAAVNKAREIMSQMPAALKTDFFLTVLENPDLAADLLTVAKTTKEKNAIAADVANYTLSRFFNWTRPVIPYVPEYGSDVLYDFKEDEQKSSRGRNRPRRTRASPPQDMLELNEKLRKAREFLDSQEQSSLQLPSRGVLPSPAPVPSGVQTASVDSAGSGSQRPQSGGISSIDINKARQLFPNDITFAARGGEMRSGIGGLFR